MAANRTSSRRVRTGWVSLLARSSTAMLLFQVATGFIVTFAPFHSIVQWSIVIHTLAGALTLLPIAWYFARHWQDYASQTLSDVLLLGYVALAAIAVCSLTGLIVTWQGLFSIKTSALLRHIHLISALASLVASVPHIAIAYWQRRKSEFAQPAAAWLRHGALACAAGLVVVAVCAQQYSGTAYHNRFPAGYSFLFGRDRPFAPSLATTSTGGAFDARSLAGSATCGSSGCHTEIYDEWKVSAHRYAAMDTLFQGIQNVMAKQNGPESTRYCGGCHDPISLFSGTKNIFVQNLTTLQGYQEGISCIACHSIQKTDIQGNAHYIMSQPREYLWQWSADHTLGAAARNFLIRTYPAEHDRLSKRVYKKPEYCAACHKQFIDQEVNRVGWVQLQNQYDNWAASHWNHKGDARKTVECRECHMPLVDSTDPAAGDASDYNRTAGDHKHRSHRFLAANNLMPSLLHLDGGDRQVQLTNEWLQGKIEVPEIRDKWASGAVVRLRIQAPASIAPGAKIPVRVILASNKVGHDFPTGPLDMIQSWVELTVADEQGKIVYSSGGRDERNFIQPGTFLFKAEPVDQYGNLIDRHNLWEMVGVRYRRSLFPGYSDTAEYEVPCPRDGSRTYRIRAVLHYRKVDQFLLNYVLGEKPGLTSPITDIASDSVNVRVAR